MPRIAVRRARALERDRTPAIATTGGVPSWPPDDDRKRLLVEVIDAHLAQNPSTPLVARSASVAAEACHSLSAEVAADVADLLDPLG